MCRRNRQAPTRTPTELPETEGSDVSLYLRAYWPRTRLSMVHGARRQLPRLSSPFPAVNDASRHSSSGSLQKCPLKGRARVHCNDRDEALSRHSSNNHAIRSQTGLIGGGVEKKRYGSPLSPHGFSRGDFFTTQMIVLYLFYHKAYCSVQATCPSGDGIWKKIVLIHRRNAAILYRPILSRHAMAWMPR